ncbi:glycerol-3-phosphate dehydrogenase/oxidase [Opitutaceae bacterium TAV4]|uniref:glycerol-3-phosphate dehydrogenase/oxidase n=1 Tax=Geminisphaera colitermitum TaxID=1148786 RepID=UPI000158D235|nr:glycerol-3-phosphate dehydrogenase/oxidase [Geminisphaera colitermitum]RRJ94675.1 glycerol-3-phosphate dehydrogenase/oxidase [Opitutaceae bacterium TAV4]RRJ98742.1 glycerol-3-phosphate dehydrogenase/oxidase [Opitutaceae bacterium TAV3]
MQRSTNLDRIASATEPFDIAIIGGGATGLGAAVDAASRGHRVALFEQADFAKGTSSRSTKLVHGGVRYLKQGNISLVLEALRERGRLARNAPHLVHDQAFIIPNYSWWEGPFYGIGMKVYDQLAGKLGLAPSRMLSREETIERLPTVEQEHLVGGVIYHDGQFDDSRLAINLAQTAEDLGAIILNYCSVTGIIKEAGSVAGIEVRDEETGRGFTVRARSVINATGVFVDGIRRMDDPAAKDIVAVSQGIHLILPKEFLPGNAAIMVPKTADGRVLFAVPWHGCVVVGTTDTPLPVHSLEPRALDEERDFVMEHARKYLTKDPTDSDVLSIYAGLRPLVKAGDGKDTAALSRDHTIIVSESGLITITGGKWTTYRKMAEDVIDHAETVAGIDDRRCRTVDLQIHGWTHATIKEPNLAPYGSDAQRISRLIQTDPDLAEKLHPALPCQRGEVIWHIREEMARTVEDVLARRTRALLLNAKASIEAAPVVAALLAKELGRDQAWQDKQVADYTTLARGYVFTDPSSHGHA